jgi:hypothetical protein
MKNTHNGAFTFMQFLFCRRKPGPLGQVRDNRLCHLSKLYVVSGVRFQVSV